MKEVKLALLFSTMVVAVTELTGDIALEIGCCDDKLVAEDEGEVGGED